MTRADWHDLLPLFENIASRPASEHSALVDRAVSEHGLNADQKQMLCDMLRGLRADPLHLEESLRPEDTLPERFGPYRVLEQIGKGGMGEVFLAERDDGAFERRVAIKTITTRVVPTSWADRFHREQAILGKLQHVGIARMLDAGVSDEGIPYLVLEYVDGQSILEFASRNQLSTRQRVELIIQVCDALAFAHNRLVLHRDIKPANLLVGADSQVRLLDFGIAKLLDDDEPGQRFQTQTGERLLTPRYASPEQNRSDALSVASDVYSVGVVLYELLTGKTPFAEVSDYELAGAQHNQSPKAPTRTVAGSLVPADLQAICLKSLEVNVADRYPTAADLGEDLRRFMGHRTISARKPGLVERAKRLRQRHPVAFPLSALAGLIIVVAVATSVWQANEAALQRDQAEAERDRAEEVSRLLIDLFDSDPFAETEERRDDLTLREFLVSRADQIDASMGDHPQLQATISELFASMLTNLALLDEANPHAEKALALNRLLHGDGPNEDLAKSLNTLGTLRQHQGRFDEAEAAFRAALAMREQLYEYDHPLVATSVNNLSALLHYWGKPDTLDEAFQLDERALQVNIKRFGARSLQAAQNYNNLAASLHARGESEDLVRAADLMSEALDIRRQLLGERHPNTINAISNLANIKYDSGNLGEADRLFRQALEYTRAAMGDEHTRVADVLYGHAPLLVDLGKLDEAIQSLTEALAIYNQALPAGHPYQADTAVALGRALVAAGSLEQAVPHFERAAGILEPRPEFIADWFEARYLLASTLESAGAHQRAMQVAAALLDEPGASQHLSQEQVDQLASALDLQFQKINESTPEN